MSITKNKTKTIHVKISSARYLADAFMDLLFFNKKVDHIKISMRRIGDFPGENVYVTCSGRGSLKGSVIDGDFHGVIRGSEKQIQVWQKFFEQFVEVPQFSLENYIKWLKSNNNSTA